MIPSQRLLKIREILLEYKHININMLSSLLSVTEVTIRRDLEKLEQEGFLKRTHGGAVLVETATEEVELADISDAYIEEKRQIGILAAQFINNNDSIFIGAGTTCLQIAKNIREKKDIYLITNNVNVGNELNGIHDIQTILTGGTIKSKNNTSFLCGSFTLRMLQNLYINKCFISVDGISIQDGLTVDDPELAEIYQIVFANCNEIILLADYSKFNIRAMMKIGPISRVKTIITNANVPPEYKNYAFENNIELFTSYGNLKAD